MKDLTALYYENLAACAKAAKEEGQPLTATTEDGDESNVRLFWAHVPWFDAVPEDCKPVLLVRKQELTYVGAPVPNAGYAFVGPESGDYLRLVIRHAR